MVGKRQGIVPAPVICAPVTLHKPRKSWLVMQSAAPRRILRRQTQPEKIMSKGMDRKKETKKQPAKTTKEKQAEKKEKKAQK
jgi:hypothetical protein